MVSPTTPLWESGVNPASFVSSFLKPSNQEMLSEAHGFCLGPRSYFLMQSSFPSCLHLSCTQGTKQMQPLPSAFLIFLLCLKGAESYEIPTNLGFWNEFLSLSRFIGFLCLFFFLSFFFLGSPLSGWWVWFSFVPFRKDFSGVHYVWICLTLWLARCLFASFWGKPLSCKEWNYGQSHMKELAGSSLLACVSVSSLFAYPFITCVDTADHSYDYDFPIFICALLEHRKVYA